MFCDLRSSENKSTWFSSLTLFLFLLFWCVRVKHMHLCAYVYMCIQDAETDK